MASIDELWQQVVETPDDLGARLVLADALIEAGDPRGELIALQCRGADAKVIVGRESPSDENTAERVSELIAANWNAWMGELAPLLVRQGSRFQDGMLALVQVGAEATPPAAWGQVADHRELCAVKRVRPFKARADHYATFLAALRRDPPFVEVHAPHVIRQLCAKRARWAIRGIRFGGMAWWSNESEPGIITSELRALAGLAPDLEVIEIPPTWSFSAEIADVALWLPKLFAKLQRVRFLDIATGWIREHEPRLRALSYVELD